MRPGSWLQLLVAILLWSVGTMALLLVGFAVTSALEDDDRPEPTVSAWTTTPSPVATATATAQPAESPVQLAARDLATLCIDRVENGEKDRRHAPSDVVDAVDRLLIAYRSDPTDPAAGRLMVVAEENLRDGCGRDQARRVAAALRGS